MTGKPADDQVEPTITTTMMVSLVLTARGLRAFADGFVAVLLPAYLLALGQGQLEVGFLSTAALFGSAIATLAVGRWGHRFDLRRMLLAAAVLMAATGFGFASFTDLWPLLIVSFLGPLNPSGGDVSVFLPLEQTVLAGSSTFERRTGIFARYSFVGSIFAAVGSLAAALPEWLANRDEWQLVDALRAMFLLYALIGVVVWLLYLRIPNPPVSEVKQRAPLGESRRIVFKLAALFSLDSFAGGLVINALLALWLFQRFGLSLSAAGLFFFSTGLLSAVSQLAAVPLARRIGLVNTMVFTHVPASLCLIAAAFAPSIEIRARPPADAQPAFPDGRPGAQCLRDVGGHAGGASCGRELHRGAAQPCRGGRPDDRRRVVRHRRAGDAAGGLRRPEDRLRPGLVHQLPAHRSTFQRLAEWAQAATPT